MPININEKAKTKHKKYSKHIQCSHQLKGFRIVCKQATEWYQQREERKKKTHREYSAN